MSSNRRVKDIAYDEDDVYSEENEDYDGTEETHTAEDKQNFADLTPVVRAHLDAAGLQSSDREIEEALWYYFWDVSKSVEYLKSKSTSAQSTSQAKKEKAKSKFDQAVEKSATKTGGRSPPLNFAACGRDWFAGISWSNVSNEITGELVPASSGRPTPRLLGGSSKLAKLAEERRRKAAAAKAECHEGPSQVETTAALSALDRLALSRSKDAKENAAPTPKPESRKYPARKKRDPTPPPPDPDPTPEAEAEEELPDLRALPSEFGRTLSASPANGGSKATKPQTTSEVSKSTPNQTAEASTAPKRQGPLPKAVELWKNARTSQRPFAAFVVIGHVDHGKSTLMGRLLLDTGAVAQRDIDKFRKQAAEIGKESFALAWVMDTGSEERERGVTVDVAQHYFSSERADFTILDAPGHRDFVPSMISGASMADMAVLVVDANQLESGMKGQTREHIELAYGVGIRRMVVAVNKLDTSNPPWNGDLYNNVKHKVHSLLVEIGFADTDVLFVPCSGLRGENVAKSAGTQTPAAKIKERHQTLVSALDSFAHDDAAFYARQANSSTTSDSNERTAQETAVLDKPLRVQVADVYRGGIQNPLSVSGRVASGHVVAGQTITIQPSGEQAVVKGIEVAGESKEWAVAYQIAVLHLDGDLETLTRNLIVGDLICATSKPVALCRIVVAKVNVLETMLPQAVDIHFGRLHLPGSVKRLVETIDQNGERVKKTPRSLKAGQTARVQIGIDSDAPFEAGNRIVVRSAGSTLAFGVIESTQSS